MNDLRAWSLATFRTSSFMTALVLTFHLRGSLQAFLQRLDTAVGFAFFAAFWLGTWVATRIGLRLAGHETPDLAPLDDVLPATIVAGGWNGVFVFAILAIGVVATFTRVEGPRTLTAAPAFLFAALIGGLLAFTVGGVVGLLYGVIEAFVALISTALVRWIAEAPVRDRRVD